MPTLSEHTKLINLLISLSHRTPDLDYPLEKRGYSLDRIGINIVLPKGQLNPDVSFKSHKQNHLLLVEAKSGGVDNEQAKKYGSLTADDISKRGLTTLPATNLAFQVCYVCLSKNKREVLENEKRMNWGFPILVFDGSSLKKEITDAAFIDKDLENLFSAGVKFNREPSYTHYPFDNSDTKGWIAYCIISKLAEFWAKETRRFSENELVRACHPLIEYLGRKERNAIRRTTHLFLVELNDKEFSRLEIKPHRNQEWELLNFVLTKKHSESLMMMADDFDKKEDFADMREFFPESDPNDS